MRTLLHGQPPGEAHPSAKLTEAEVRAVRVRIAGGELQSVVAAELGVSPSAISKIMAGKSWVHLGPPGPIPKKRGSERPTAKLTEGDVPDICQAINRGVKLRALARHYGVSPTTIAKVWKGETWQHVPRPEKAPDEIPVRPERKKVWEQG